MYIADIKLVEWFSYISWIVFLNLGYYYYYCFLLLGLLFVFSRSSSLPRTLSPFGEVIILWKSEQNWERKRGGFGVKENYFYKCGNKSLSFNHVAAWMCETETPRDCQTEYTVK